MVRIPIITKYVQRKLRKLRCKKKQKLGREVAWIPSDNVV